MKLTEQPWWTAADKAELDKRTWQFVEVAWEHKTCRACKRRRWCDIPHEEFERLLVWRQARVIASKAEYLSAQAYERRRHSTA